jgi:hypothetical protein
MELNNELIKSHIQIGINTCVPMSVEMVLKLEKRLPCDETSIQESMKSICPVGGNHFDGKVYNGIEFKQLFGPEQGHPRGKDFPFDDLFKTIREELEKKKFVTVSLWEKEGGFHNYTIYDYDSERDEFLGVTKRIIGDPKLFEEKNVKKRIREMDGTDILVYNIQSETK